MNYKLKRKRLQIKYKTYLMIQRAITTQVRIKTKRRQILPYVLELLVNKIIHTEIEKNKWRKRIIKYVSSTAGSLYRVK